MSDDDLMNFQIRVGNGILGKINAVLLDGTRHTDPVAIAMDSLVRRMVNSGSTLIALRGSPHDWSPDGNAILRTIYDTSLQALYILHDPCERLALATRFIDFSIV